MLCEISFLKVLSYGITPFFDLTSISEVMSITSKILSKDTAAFPKSGKITLAVTIPKAPNIKENRHLNMFSTVR